MATLPGTVYQSKLAVLASLPKVLFTGLKKALVMRTAYNTNLNKGSKHRADWIQK